jgi:putative ABC transport system substrate-binding protein
MRPRERRESGEQELFRSRLDQIIDMNHALVKLARTIDWRFIRDPGISAGIGLFGAIQSVAPSLGVELSPVNVRDAGEIERAIAAFALSGNGGLILTPSALAFVHRNLIVTLAARHRLPAVYFARAFAVAGGLVSYGPDIIDQYRRAAGYVDRILKGEKPADLPVQAPKFELVINQFVAF